MAQPHLDNPLQALFHWEQQRGDKTFLKQPVAGVYKEFSWALVADQVRRIAAALKGLGLQPGDRVAIISKNCAEWFISDLALMLAELVSVPVYPTANAETIGYVLNHSGCKAAFIGKLDSLEGVDTPQLRQLKVKTGQLKGRLNPPSPLNIAVPQITPLSSGVNQVDAGLTGCRSSCSGHTL